MKLISTHIWADRKILSMKKIIGICNNNTAPHKLPKPNNFRTEPTLDSQGSLRASLVNGRPGDTRVLPGVQLGGVGDEQRVVVGHAEARLVLEVDGLSVVQPDYLQV